MRVEGPASAPPLPCRLLLMALYNVSINLKGLRHISESPGFLPLLWWLLSGKEGSPAQPPWPVRLCSAADGGGDGLN